MRFIVVNCSWSYCSDSLKHSPCSHWAALLVTAARSGRTCLVCLSILSVPTCDPTVPVYFHFGLPDTGIHFLCSQKAFIYIWDTEPAVRSGWYPPLNFKLLVRSLFGLWPVFGFRPVHKYCRIHKILNSQWEPFVLKLPQPFHNTRTICKYAPTCQKKLIHAPDNLAISHFSIVWSQRRWLADLAEKFSSVTGYRHLVSMTGNTQSHVSYELLQLIMKTSP